MKMSPTKLSQAGNHPSSSAPSNTPNDADSQKISPTANCPHQQIPTQAPRPKQRQTPPPNDTDPNATNALSENRIAHTGTAIADHPADAPIDHHKIDSHTAGQQQPPAIRRQLTAMTSGAVSMPHRPLKQIHSPQIQIPQHSPNPTTPHEQIPTTTAPLKIPSTRAETHVAEAAETGDQTTTAHATTINCLAARAKMSTLQKSLS